MKLKNCLGLDIVIELQKKMFGFGHLHWTSNLLREFRLDSALVKSGCHNKIQQTGRYKRVIFLPFWRLKSETRSPVGLLLWELTFPLVGGCLLAVFSPTLSLVGAWTVQRNNEVWQNRSQKTIGLGQEKCWFLCSCVDWHLCDFLMRRMLGHPWKWCFLYL